MALNGNDQEMLTDMFAETFDKGYKMGKADFLRKARTWWLNTFCSPEMSPGVRAFYEGKVDQFIKEMEVV